jgi:hypothetical protein
VDLNESLFINWRQVRYAELLGQLHKGPMKGHWLWRIRFAGTRYLDLPFPESPERYMREAPVVPALPGFSFIAPMPDGGGFWSGPIVAWRVDSDRAEPVSDDWIPKEYGIRRPDGSVIDQDRNSYKGADEWLDAQRAREDKRVAQSADNGVGLLR